MDLNDQQRSEATMSLIKVAVVEMVLLIGVIAAYFYTDDIWVLIGGIAGVTLVMTPFIVNKVRALSKLNPMGNESSQPFAKNETRDNA